MAQALSAGHGRHSRHYPANTVRKCRRPSIPPRRRGCNTDCQRYHWWLLVRVAQREAQREKVPNPGNRAGHPACDRQGSSSWSARVPASTVEIVGQPAELYVLRQYMLEDPSWLKTYRAKCKGGKTEVVEEECAFPRCPQNDKTRFSCDVHGCKRAAHIECYRAYAHHAHGYKYRVSKAMFDIPVACYECHLTLAYAPPGSSASGLSKYPPHAPFR